MLEGARISNVEEHMYTSTYGVYSNKGEMKENKMWKNNPQRMISLLMAKRMVSYRLRHIKNNIIGIRFT